MKDTLQEDRSHEAVIKRLHASSIIRNPAFQIRTKTDPTWVKKYVTAHKFNGERVSPVTVAQHRSAFILVDGFHRMEAMDILYGQETEGGDYMVECEVVPVDTKEEAEWLAAIGNAYNGKPLSSEDKQRVLATYILTGRHHDKERSGAKGRRYAVKSLNQMAADMHGMIHPQTLKSWLKRSHKKVYRAWSQQTKLMGNTGPRREHFKPYNEDRMKTMKMAREAIAQLKLVGVEIRDPATWQEFKRLCHEELADIEAGIPSVPAFDCKE